MKLSEYEKQLNEYNDNIKANNKVIEISNAVLNHLGNSTQIHIVTEDAKPVMILKEFPVELSQDLYENIRQIINLDFISQIAVAQEEIQKTETQKIDFINNAEVEADDEDSEIEDEEKEPEFDSDEV